MGVLNAAQRKALPSSTFAVPSKAPGSGSYPIPDKGHAEAALSMSSRFGSPATKAAVRAKVHAKFPNMGKAKKSANRNKIAQMRAGR